MRVLALHAFRFQQATFEAYKDRFVGLGMSEPVAQGMTDIAAAKNEGLDNAVKRTPENSTPTSFGEWCEEVLEPTVNGDAELDRRGPISAGAWRASRPYARVSATTDSRVIGGRLVGRRERPILIRVLKAEQGLKLRTVRLIELRDDGVGLEAFVVIDHDLFPVSAGGTRMLPDVDLEEVTRLARAMTWKHAAFHLPYAGAKAGVRFASGNREALLVAYRLALKPYSEIFLTGPDMGTFPADFIEDSDDPAPLWALSHEGLGMDDLATGHGVKAAAEAGLAHLARTLEGATVAVEGFGKVGAGTARACARAGARIVGVSTVHGLVTDSTGLDVEDLLTLRERHGDRFVEHASSKVRPREALFELECDVLVPGARPHSITAGVAQRLRCAVVSPAANIPYGAGSLDVLHQRGVVAVPDFMSNGGGNFLYELDQDKGPAEALAAIEVLVHERVVRVLATAEDLRITPYAGALRDARNYVAQATDASAEMLDELFSI